MPATRRSAAKSGSSPVAEKTAGTKRKASEATSPESVKSKRPSKEQKTLEESIAATEGKQENGTSDKQENGTSDKQENGDSKKQENGDTEMKEPEAKQPSEEQKEEPKAQQNGDEKAEANGTEKTAFDDVKADEKEDGKTSKVSLSDEFNRELHAQPEEDKPDAATGDSKGTAIEEDKEREKAQPSNVLEKGIIYFFTRGRVGMDDPSSVTELQRSFFVLRPLPAGAKITDGFFHDVGNNRLIALPKKVWPKSGRDRFMAFVEKSKTSMDNLKETFFQGSDYSTKTTGTRHTPEVSPIGEGVYAMTSTGDGRTTTHLAYMLTIPTQLGEVQKDVGLAEKGSFILSSKNPESSSPSYAQLPATADYPKEILDEFGSRGWLPTKPEHLDYDNASMLLIGEDIDNALEATAQDKKSEDQEVPEEELIKLEEEDEERIKNLKGDKTVFEDLGISSKEYSLRSTW